MSNPWDKHLEPAHETIIEAHGYHFVISTDTARAFGEPRDGRAVFSRGEIQRLNLSARGGKLPQSLSVTLHLVKRTLGGRVDFCRLSS